MNTKRTLAIAVITLALTASAFAQTEPRRTNYSLYGQTFLSSWQSLRLVADNPRYSDSEIIPCIRMRWIATFFEMPLGDPPGGGILRPIRRVTREIEVDPGQAASFDIPATLACADPPGGTVCPQIRNGVYVSVSVFAAPEGVDPPEPDRLKFNSTVSVREFGKTIFTLPAVQRGFDPQPDPPSLR